MLKAASSPGSRGPLAGLGGRTAGGSLPPRPNALPDGFGAGSAGGGYRAASMIYVMGIVHSPKIAPHMLQALAFHGMAFRDQLPDGIAAGLQPRLIYGETFRPDLHISQSSQEGSKLLPVSPALIDMRPSNMLEPLPSFQTESHLTRLPDSGFARVHTDHQSSRSSVCNDNGVACPCLHRRCSEIQEP